MEKKPRRHLCILVGQMEVPQSVISCRAGETYRLSRQCYEAVTGTGAATPAGLFGRVERGCMGVEVEITPTHITVKHGDLLVNNIRLQDLKFLMAMRSPGDSGNHVVAAGYCQNEQTSVALVFEFADLEVANCFIKDYQGCCMRGAFLRKDTQPQFPARPTSVELPKHPSLSSAWAAPADSQENPYEDDTSKPPLPPRTSIHHQEKPALPPRKSDMGGAYKPTLPRRDNVVEQTSPIAATAKPPLPLRISDKFRSSSDTASKIPPPLPRRGTEAAENCDAAGSSKAHSPRFQMFNPFLKKERKGEEAPKGQNQAKKGIFSLRRKNVKYENVEMPVEMPVSEESETVTSSPTDDKEFADYEFPDSDNDSYENFYESLDLTVEDSERIFCYETVPHAEKDNQSSSQADRINYFLTDEYNYLTSLSCITAAKTLSPELQPFLRGVDTLEQLHHDLYRELYSSNHSYSSIAQAFLSRREQLESYKYHMMNGPLIYKALAQVSETNLKDHPNLKDSLRISWKRLHFYFMSLEEFLCSAPEGDKGVMQEAVTMLRELHALGDSAILIDGVKGSPFDLHIKAPLLLHGSFKIKGPEMQRKDYRALLFAEMLVITLSDGWTSRYQCSLRIDQLIPISQKSESVSSFSVQVSDGRGKGKLYVFTARDEKTKEKWFNEITRLTTKIADEVKREFEKRYGVKPVA